MAASDASDEQLFRDLPEGLPLGKVKTAWEHRDLIGRLAAKGKTSREIFPLVHAPVKAVEWVMAHLPAPGGPEAGSDRPDPGRAEPSGPSPTRARAEEGGPTGAAPVGPPRAEPLSPAGGEPPAARPSPAPPLTPYGRGGDDRGDGGGGLQPAYAAPSMADIGEALRPSFVAGRIEMPDLNARVADACGMFGIHPDRAKGIATAFAFTSKDARDYARLKTIIRQAGYPEGIAEGVVATYRGIASDSPPEDQGGQGDGKPPAGPKLPAVLKAAGVASDSIGGDDPDMVARQLDAKLRALQVKEAEMNIAERERKLGGGAPGSVGDDPITDQVLVINGMPTPMKIRQSQLPMYARWMSGPEQGGDPKPEEPPAWAKAIMDEQAAQRREREEARRRQEEDERLRLALTPLVENNRKLEERIASLSAGGGTESKMAEEIRLMREAREKERRDEVVARLDRLSQDVHNANTPEGIRLAQDRYLAGARQFGLVPRSEAGALVEEQIQLEAERKANAQKAEATSAVLEVAKKKMEEPGPLRKIGTSVADAGVGKEIIEFAKKKLGADTGPGGDGGGELVPPTDDQYAEATRRMQAEIDAQAALRAPPAPPVEAPPAGYGRAPTRIPGIVER